VLWYYHMTNAGDRAQKGQVSDYLEPVQAATLSVQVARQLRDLLAAGGLLPGDRLPSERDLADRLGVGRPAVREALRELRAHGLLVTGRGRQGTTVAERPGQPAISLPLAAAPETNTTTALDLMVYRRAVECEAAALAARRANLDDLRGIARAIPERRNRLTSEEDGAFHLSVAASCHNQFLEGAVAECNRLLRDQLQVVLGAIYGEPTGPATIQRQHTAVYEAIKNGDEETARRSMDAHLTHVIYLLTRLLGEQPRIRMVVSDLDGTLLSGPRHISERTRLALAEARDAGVHVILASARPPRSMRRYHEALALTAPVIACNGALLWDLHAGIPMARIAMESELAFEITQLGRSLGTIVNLESDDEWFTDRTNERILRNIRTFGIPPPDGVGVIDEMLERGEPVDKIFLDLRDLAPEHVETARTTVAQSIGRRANLTETVPGLLDIVAAGATKAAMAQRLARSLGVKAEEVLALGDHDNDVSLLRWAGIGVAMGNATPAAKAAADTITSSNRRDGLAEALQRWVLDERRGQLA
jgi:Cof subfamily protein (haloacid dehalogenase superfamily)